MKPKNRHKRPYGVIDRSIVDLNSFSRGLHDVFLAIRSRQVQGLMGSLASLSCFQAAVLSSRLFLGTERSKSPQDSRASGFSRPIGVKIIAYNINLYLSYHSIIITMLIISTIIAIVLIST